jgi:undecaprenyl diphosphate synthase
LSIPVLKTTLSSEQQQLNSLANITPSTQMMPVSQPPTHSKAIPKHIAIIMDGNGRWAKGRNLKRSDGHVQGAKMVNGIVTHCSAIGVEYLTLYAFSVQNWGRPLEEVNTLMNLLVSYIVQEKETFIRNQIKFETIGRFDDLPIFVQEPIKMLKAETASFKGMRLTLALSYGGREEIVEATKKIASLVQSGAIKADQIDEKLIQKHLYAPDLPDPDILIRTSGELRISNFLLWQSAYTELYFSDVPWPEFQEKEIDDAIAHFQNRERRFGLTSEQVQMSQKLNS